MHDRCQAARCDKEGPTHSPEPNERPIVVERSLQIRGAEAAYPASCAQIDSGRVAGVQAEDDLGCFLDRVDGVGEVVAYAEAGPPLVSRYVTHAASQADGAIRGGADLGGRSRTCRHKHMFDLTTEHVFDTVRRDTNRCSVGRSLRFLSHPDSTFVLWARAHRTGPARVGKRQIGDQGGDTDDLAAKHQRPSVGHHLHDRCSVCAPPRDCRERTVER